MYSIKKGFEDKNVFIFGNTKKITECTEQEIAVLQKNYNSWFVKKTEENSGGNLIAETTESTVSNEIVDSGATVTEAQPKDVVNTVSEVVDTQTNEVPTEEVVTRNTSRKKSN